MIKQNKIPLKCYVILFIFHCPCININVLGETNNDFDYNYSPSWEDLDTRPLPQWYDSAKIGILINWGLHSVPSFKDESLFAHGKNGAQLVQNHIKANNYSSTIRSYEDFGPMFKAEKFDPKEWAQLFVKSGARYVVVTAKYKDGFTMFLSDRPKWNSVEVGPKKDIVYLLSQAIRENGMKFGIYYAVTEWFNKLFIEEKDQDKRKEIKTVYIDTVIVPEIKFLVDQYEPSILWSDGDDDVRCSTYWKSPEILAWIYNESPVKDEIVVNDRWSSCSRCLHGDFYSNANCYRELIPHKWEYPVKLDNTPSGYVRDMKSEDVLSLTDILQILVSTVSRGGNVLFVVGPTKEGIIAPSFQERLKQLGRWLEIHGEAIYNTSRWLHQKDSLNPDVWYTCTIAEYHNPKEGMTNETMHTTKAVYAIFLKWPDDNMLKLADLIPYIMEEDVEISMIKPHDVLVKQYDSQKKKNVNNNYIAVTHSTYGNTTLEVLLPTFKRQMPAWVLKVEFKTE